MLWSADNLWAGPPHAWRVIPTNLTVRADGTAVMGAGLARQAAARHPDLPYRLGAAIQTGHHSLVAFNDIRICALPTKRHWRDPSPWDLVQDSLRALRAFALAHPDEPIRVPLLGAGLGGLPADQVQAAMDATLGDLPHVTGVLPPPTASLPPEPWIAAVGSRTLPPGALAVCTRLGAALARRGLTLVTGGAPGADQAFARGIAAVDARRLWLVLPWEGFEEATLRAWIQAGARVTVATLDDPRSAASLAAHPARDRLTPAAQRLLARDGWILEPDPGHPVRGVLAWPAGPSGGTRHTMALATARGLPMADLSNPVVRARWLPPLHLAR